MKFGTYNNKMFIIRQQNCMILSYFNILAVVLLYNLSKSVTEGIHLSIIIDQINLMSNLLKKCGAQIETRGKCQRI